MGKGDGMVPRPSFLGAFLKIKFYAGLCEELKNTLGVI